MNDLLVIGAGPAGLASALYAAQAGLDVTVWDKRTGTIDKACGEGLMPGAVTALGHIGVDPDGTDLAGIRYLAGRHHVEARFRDGPGRGVRRTALHRAMGAAAATAGIAIQQRCVRQVRPGVDDVAVNDRRFRYVIAADGLHSPIRHQLGLDADVRSPRRYGLRRHYQLAPWTSHVEVHWAKSAEAYVTPVGDNVVGVAVLTSTRGSFSDHLRRFPSLCTRLRGAVPCSDVRGAGPLRQRATSQVAGRLVLVGDASGYVDALTGEGVALALAQAQAAVHAVLDQDPSRYQRDWRRITRQYRLLTTALLGATRFMPARRALVPTAKRLPGVFSAAVNALAG